MTARTNGAAKRARRDLANFRAFVRRGGLTGWTTRDAAGQFRAALRSVLALEDACGVEAAAALSDRLTALRQEAVTAGPLTTEAVIKIEDEVTA